MNLQPSIIKVSHKRENAEKVENDSFGIYLIIKIKNKNHDTAKKKSKTKKKNSKDL